MIGGPQTSLIDSIDTNQRVLIRGGQGSDGGEKHKGDYYYPKGDALVTTTWLEKKVIRQTRNVTTGGSDDAGEHAASPPILRSQVYKTEKRRARRTSR